MIPEASGVLARAFGPWRPLAWARLIRLVPESRTLFQWGWKDNVADLRSGEVVVVCRKGLCGQVLAPLDHPLDETIGEVARQVLEYKRERRME